MEKLDQIVVNRDKELLLQERKAEKEERREAARDEVRAEVYGRKGKMQDNREGDDDDAGRGKDAAKPPGFMYPHIFTSYLWPTFRAILGDGCMPAFMVPDPNYVSPDQQKKNDAELLQNIYRIKSRAVHIEAKKKAVAKMLKLFEHRKDLIGPVLLTQISCIYKESLLVSQRLNELERFENQQRDAKTVVIMLNTIKTQNKTLLPVMKGFDTMVDDINEAKDDDNELDAVLDAAFRTFGLVPRASEDPDGEYAADRESMQKKKDAEINNLAKLLLEKERKVAADAKAQPLHMEQEGGKEKGIAIAAPSRVKYPPPAALYDQQQQQQPSKKKVRKPKGEGVYN